MLDQVAVKDFFCGTFLDAFQHGDHACVLADRIIMQGMDDVVGFDHFKMNPVIVDLLGDHLFEPFHLRGASILFVHGHMHHADMRIPGFGQNNEFFKGEIDEYAYWTSALSSDNIEWLSQNSLAGPGVPGRPTNLALGKPYAWELHAPGQVPNSGPHYLDDTGNAGGSHAVHSPANNFGAFSLGELTDGVRQAGGPGGAGQPVLAQWGGAPAANIIFDLGQLSEVQEIIIGTHIAAGANNNAPDDVTISFSTTGSAPGDFGAGTFFDLEAMFGPLADGSHGMLLDIADLPAQFVKLSFDGGSMAEPDGSDPDEKWMLDEVVINGVILSDAVIPEPSTFALAALGLLGLAFYARRRRRLP